MGPGAHGNVELTHRVASENGGCLAKQRIGIFADGETRLVEESLSLLRAVVGCQCRVIRVEVVEVVVEAAARHAQRFGQARQTHGVDPFFDEQALAGLDPVFLRFSCARHATSSGGR